MKKHMACEYNTNVVYPCKMSVLQADLYQHGAKSMVPEFTIKVSEHCWWFLCYMAVMIKSQANEIVTITKCIKMHLTKAPHGLGNVIPSLLHPIHTITRPSNARLCSTYNKNNERTQVDGILPKGPCLPCLRMADMALLAAYPRSKPSKLLEISHASPSWAGFELSAACVL